MWWLDTQILDLLRFLRCSGGCCCRSIIRCTPYWRSSLLRVTLGDLDDLVSVVGMVRVGWVQEGELWVVSLSFSNFVFELRRVCRARNECGRSVDNGCGARNTVSSRELNVQDGKGNAHFISGGGKMSPVVNLGAAAGSGAGAVTSGPSGKPFVLGTGVPDAIGGEADMPEVTVGE